MEYGVVNVNCLMDVKFPSVLRSKNENETETASASSISFIKTLVGTVETC